MGSSSSKDASGKGDSRRVRFFRPACWRRPPVSLDDENGDGTGGSKEIGCLGKLGKIGDGTGCLGKLGKIGDGTGCLGKLGKIGDGTGGSKEIGCLGKLGKIGRNLSGRRYGYSVGSHSQSPSNNNVDGVDKDDKNSSSLTSMEPNSSLGGTHQASPPSCAVHFHSCFSLPNENTNTSREGVGTGGRDDGDCESSVPCEPRDCLGRTLDSSQDIADEHDSKNASGTDAAASDVHGSESECAARNPNSGDGMECKLSERRQEPLEGPARFSRTRSVGRLRDRVLRRSSLAEGRFGFLFTEESSAFGRQDSRRRLLNALANVPYSGGEGNDAQLGSSNHRRHRSSSEDSSPEDGHHSNGPETSELRETSSHDAVEHSSSFFERRWRIRSQVRALQRLGSRFENISGHDRQCIYSGQHRTGSCRCGVNNRSRNPPEEQTSTRASISRIVMLAEALFEVLDEIHQQAVVLVSRPSMESSGSVPAPKEIVDRMPVKTYVKSQKRRNDERAQCYICLVEYEDGDNMRILPCLHDFHQSCVDKWLKEIHRVCPLCRHDVCLSQHMEFE